MERNPAETDDAAEQLTLAFEPLQFLPGLLRVLAEDHDVVLAFVEIKTQTRLDVAFALTVDRARDVIDVNEHSAALRMGKLDVFHRFMPQKKRVDNNRNG